MNRLPELFRNAMMLLNKAQLIILKLLPLDNSLILLIMMPESKSPIQF